MDPDNSVVKARGLVAGWGQAKKGEIGGICNSVKNEKNNNTQTKISIEPKIYKCFKVFTGLIALVMLTVTMKEGIREIILSV